MSGEGFVLPHYPKDAIEGQTICPSIASLFLHFSLYLLFLYSMGSNLTDEELFEFISLRDEDPELAKEALSELYLKYREFLFKCLSVMFKKETTLFNKKEIAQSLVNDLFCKIFEKGIRPSKLKGAELSQSRRIVSAWLSTSIKRLWLDYIKVENKSPKIYVDVDTLSIAMISETSEHESQSIEKELLLEELEKLDHRERTILLKYFEYKDDVKRIPSVIIDSLAEEFSTTKDNVKTLYKRAFKKISERLKSRIPEKKQ